MIELIDAIENSAVAYLEATVTGSVSTIYYTGQNNQDITPEMYGSSSVVIVSARSGNEIALYTNLYEIELNITVAEYSYGNQNIGQLAAYVFNCFYTNNRSTYLSTYGVPYGFTCLQIKPAHKEPTIKGSFLINEQTFSVIGGLNGTVT